MSRKEELWSEYDELMADFRAASDRFLLYMKAGKMEDAEAVNAWMKTALARQREIVAELTELSPRSTQHEQ